MSHDPFTAPRRVCVLDPMGVICVALVGLCLGIAVWGWSDGHAGPMVIGGLVGFVAAFVAWRLGSEEPAALLSPGGVFWRASLVDERELTAEGIEMEGRAP
jgi:hypothetical protein